MNVISKIVSCGILPEMEEFKAERKRIYNRVSLILMVTYMTTFLLGCVVGSFFLSAIVFVSLCLSFLSFYFCSKQRMWLSKIALTLGPWIVLTGFTIYFGQGSGAAYALFTTAILWFIIFNRIKEIVVVEILNLIVFIANLLIQAYSTPLFEGKAIVVDILMLFNILVSVLVVMITMVMFKMNSYKFLALVRDHRLEVQERQREIHDSINYAKRIQNAILPADSTLEKLLKDYFVLYRPKDIVAGDFYWITQQSGYTFVAVADCTGHGVPGAMVSVICNGALNSAVRELKLTDTAQILNKTQELVVQEFEKSDEDVRDGMDITLCAIKGNELQFSGAHNSLWIIRGEEFITLQADKQPIGQYDYAQPFSAEKILLEKGDQFYLTTDGYADQFGGEKGKKLKSKYLIELLKEMKDEPMSVQKAKLEDFIEVWKRDYEQVDDICILGFRY